jgi:hypothetical protein
MLCIWVLVLAFPSGLAFGVTPSNDLCSGAIALADGATHTMSTTDATATNDPTPTCGFNVGKGVWFTYTAATCGTVSVDVCGSDFDTVVQVYAGGCATLTALPNGCNDQGCGAQGFQSLVAFNGTAGTTYRIFVSGFLGASGTLRIVASSQSAPTPNDACAGAVELVRDVVYTTCTSQASSAGDPASVCGATAGKGVWFTFTPCGDGTVTVTTAGARALPCDPAPPCDGQSDACSSDFDTVIAVYTGGCGTLTQIACNDDACGAQKPQAIVTFAGAAGTTYRVFVGGKNGASGTLRIKASLNAPSAPNDFCAGAIPLTSGVSYTMNTGCATSAGDPVISCDFSAGKGVWFSYTATCSGTVTVSTCASLYDTVLAVYTGACATLTSMVGCNDDACGYHNLMSNVSFNATGGTTYLILVSGYAGTSGPLQIVVTEIPLTNPSNLIVQSVTLNKSAYTGGEAGTATITVRNDGSSGTGVIFAVELFRNASLSVGCTTSYNSIVLRKAMRPGASETFAIPFTNTTTPGNYTLRVFADGSCIVGESNEINNQATTSYSVGAGGASVSDTGTPSTP